jgi:hypothetical protein
LNSLQICCSAYVAYCAGFRTPATTSYPRAPAAGVRKAPRHEIASGGGARAVPQKKLWGFGGAGVEVSATCVGYPAQTEMQLKRFGTNIAIWGFHVLSHQGFQQLKRRKAARLNNFCAISLMTSFSRQHRACSFRSSSRFGLPSRNCFDLLVKIIVGPVITSDHDVVVRHFFVRRCGSSCVQSIRGRTMLMRSMTPRSSRQRASPATHDLSPGVNAQDEPHLATIA